MNMKIIGIGEVKKGESAAIKIMALMFNKPEGKGWVWNRLRAHWINEEE
jgi:hypothetical protein